METVTVKGQEYVVERFTGLQLNPLLKGLQDLDDIDLQANIAKALKRIIIPTLPNTVIDRDSQGEYAIYLEPFELQNLIMQVLRIYYRNRLQENDLGELQSEYVKRELANVERALGLIESGANKTEVQVDILVPEEVLAETQHDNSQGSAETVDELRSKLRLLEEQQQKSVET